MTPRPGTPPQSRMLTRTEVPEEAVREIEAQGGIAWVRSVRGDDMGHENVYWGEEVVFFTPEQVLAAAARTFSVQTIRRALAAFKSAVVSRESMSDTLADAFEDAQVELRKVEP